MKYFEFYCISIEEAPFFVVFKGKDAEHIKEIRIYDHFGDGIFLPLGLVEEIREIVKRWLAKYPCFRDIEEGNEE